MFLFPTASRLGSLDVPAAAATTTMTVDVAFFHIHGLVSSSIGGKTMGIYFFRR